MDFRLLDVISIHTPAWGVTFVALLALVRIGVSIHTPRVGGDAAYSALRFVSSVFQSTPPRGG